MNPQIEKLMKIISEAQDIINAIRVACPHEEYEVTQRVWAPGHYNILRICLSCNGAVKGATDAEIKEFIKKQDEEEPERRLTSFELESLIQTKRKPQ